MSDTPGHAVSEALRQGVMSDGERRHRSQMVGVGGVSDAEQETDQQYADFVHA